jgi:hypothetical protein
LFGQAGTLVEVIEAREDLLSFFETNSSLGILSQLLALARIEFESRCITVIPLFLQGGGD